MMRFTYRLPPGYAFSEDGQGGYIAGALPKRRITLAAKSAAVLKALLAGQALELTAEEEKTLLYLASKSYLQIAALPFHQSGAAYPLVSVIIPVKDRAADLQECLASLRALNWPAEKLEIIVVDDGSTDQSPAVATAAGALVLKNPVSQGPAFARNKGAELATGEVLAFIDSDCVAAPEWLEQLVPWLQQQTVGAVGGEVASYYDQSALDRYEEACSSLSISKRLIYETDLSNNFYVPTCNMLVKTELFRRLGGFNPAMHLGEDVDFCWRLRNHGPALLYVPEGKIWHKHRNILLPMMKRKFAYGTSEADLYRRHRDKKKRMPLPLFSLLFFAGLSLALLFFNPVWLLLSLGAWLLATLLKKRLCRKIGDPVTLFAAAGIALRSAVAFCYYLCFHIIRYYLLLLIVVALCWPALFAWLAAALLFISLVDWRVKKARLHYLGFAFYYLLEQVFYQAGVLAGAFKHRYGWFYLVWPQVSL